MNFFAQMLQQPPVSDKNQNNDESDHEDEFTVTKGKTLRGFNDDVSEIEVGSDLINDDSINEMKIEHKMLSGNINMDIDRPLRRNTEKSLQERKISDPFLGQNVVYETQNKKKDSRNSKLSVQPKITFKQMPTAEFAPLHKQYSLSSSQTTPSNFVSKSSKRKKLVSQLMINLSELKKLKVSFNQMIHEETLGHKKYFQAMRLTAEIQLRKKLTQYVANIERKARQNYGMNNLSSNEEEILKAKLNEAENLLKEYKQQIDQISQENEMLQEKQFDLQQKIIGVDLQVEQKFEKKRKQLEKKIYQQFKNSPQSISQATNHQNTEIVQNLIKQNQFLSNKIRSYEKVLLEADQIRKMKQSIEQRELILGKKESDLEMKKNEIDTQLKQSQKQSVSLSISEEALNRQISQVKNGLKVKEEELLRWQEELKRKAREIDQKQQPKSPKGIFTAFPRPSQPYNVTFQKPTSHPKTSFENTLPSDEQFSRKMQTLNMQKISNQKKFSTNNRPDLQTFRNNAENEEQKNKQKSETERFFKKEENSLASVNIIYNPRNHEKYEQFDRKQRQKAYLMSQNPNYEKYANLEIEKKYSPNNAISNQQRSSKKIEFDNVSKDSSLSKNRLGSFKLSHQNENKKLSAQFYQPSVRNTFKYEPQLVQKPLSTPSSQPPTNLQSNYKAYSPHNRDNSPHRTNHNNFRQNYLQVSHDRSNFSRSSKNDSISSYNRHEAKSSARTSFQGFDMSKSKQNFQMGKLNDLGNKIESLKNQLKNEIDTIY